MSVVTPRYPADQDSNEHGLSLLRRQYVKAGTPHLAWKETPKGAEIVGSNAAVILLGEGSRNLATLICRAVSLGWLMLNELEPAVNAGSMIAESGHAVCPCCRKIIGKVAS